MPDDVCCEVSKLPARNAYDPKTLSMSRLTMTKRRSSVFLFFNEANNPKTAALTGASAEVTARRKDAKLKKVTPDKPPRTANEDKLGETTTIIERLVYSEANSFDKILARSRPHHFADVRTR